jgi:hypothetical protein
MLEEIIKQHMITLDNHLWKTLEGGYKILYDVSIPLKKLEQATDEKEIEEVWTELWNELHHQGNVGIASYLALPQLVRIAVNKDLYNWNLLGICSTIEQQRHLGDNPQLPGEYQDYYNDGLEVLKQFVIANINRKTDETTFRIALSTLAVCEGKINLSKAIGELEDDVLKEFLEQF